MSTLIEEAVERTPLTDHDGRSGARLERVRMPDGRSLIVKWIDPATDLAMAATGDTIGREHVLWSQGYLDRLPAGLGHVVVQTWPTATGAAIAMRDVSPWMLGWSSRLTRDQCRVVLEAVNRMHARFAGVPIPGACSLGTRIGALTPHVMLPLAGGSNSLPGSVLRGWEVFAEIAPRDVAAAFKRILARPDLVADPMWRLQRTLVHGDLSLPNIALEPDQVTLLDWGLITDAPPEYEIAWFLADSGGLVDATLDEILADYRGIAGAAHDPRAMRLSLVAALAGLGWDKAISAATHPDAASRAECVRDLHWWCAAVRPGLEEIAL